MDPRFAQVVLAAITANFNYTKQIDERTGGSGQNEVSLNEAIMALQNLTSQVNEQIDIPAEPVEQPAA
ncbi:MAG: hypothetical protein JGK17_06160 [Microcoleus sp. PH2017_10_PVI_O_A]|uniref:hypothetical protein n=1 Tax=unclassified Microcoleus TaxID=2642155 RepID=UPI001D66C1E0|nr:MULTISPECIES: hypothetical protein [unclassified Microcoleus]TAE84486.1 MAG: hypothetical protein EAZ83_05880 [Oscillatoriales cyanobacterium]MCC3405170.1 hypothetical protein [Microcoleus sp. PH2017_10_PVI_O_A]MCC3459256.1 hypothetical protein [Microcoleus sp. PH2017_11_PCY_U_A]MCC3477428.1 hypothetical protein [Microcoleus sp. PH2017_12_PCY_D_A]MCC3558521.1 hypothetical protein [Microcoleus sp. PH2017_27_LUM_O_A]